MYDSNDTNILTTIQPCKKKSVVLTFDDGPSKMLPIILDILQKEGVQAVFFWQSHLIYAKRPWQRTLDEGHLIGTHSMKHRNLTTLTFQQQLHDIESSKKVIEQTIHSEVTLFRPPFGQCNRNTIKAAQQLHLTPVMWRVASFDWELKDNPNQIITNVIDHLEDGAIILLHELKQTVAILPELISKIREEGYTFSLI
ncbi:polysaccharide deacetylase family protein [Aquibacillus rhizosphaerae]|uniref:Polysaccharide deacetylase family protein n=1 Tax=Aquibacillus rhizosphaerae TaxID=3051431 RepID=A0ABT7L8T4_9BACI|nr:polysaccharide deacetylase family protein [Aquibacillus sp. LR5S19]MDL4842266.1 polysaccharide deacetylase family protein [Aquibacillus sp. LR5S19]